MVHRFAVAAALSAGMALMAHTASAQTYAVTALNTLPGQTSVTVTGINNLGQIVGISGGYAFRTNTDGIIASAQILGAATSATAINDSGQVVVSANNHSYLVNGNETLSTATDIGIGLTARAINNNGVVAGFGDSFAWRWSTTDGLQNLTSGNGHDSIYVTPTSINSGSNIAGYRMDALNGPYNGFLTQANGTTYSANSSPTGGLALIFGVNDANHIVGTQVQHGPFTDSNEAAYFDGTTVRVVDPLSGNARDINNHDLVIGTEGGVNGYMWTPSGGLVYLSSAVQDSAGWTFDSPIAVNDLGEIIGDGSYNGVQTPFLLKPITAAAAPEPCSVTLLTLPLLYERIWRRRSFK